MYLSKNIISNYYFQEFDVYSNRLTEIDLPVSIQKLDLAKNRISQHYLVDKYGSEFLQKYDRWQAAIREDLDGLDEERGNLEEMLEEISESIKYGMSDVSSDEYSFEQEEVANIYTHQEEKQVIVAFSLLFTYVFNLLFRLALNSMVS